jgi:hypothetical protein
MAKVSSKMTAKGRIAVLLHSRWWNWPLRRQAVFSARENAQILALQGESARWVS